MAIPTLPGIKRRRGVGNEVAAFAQAFSQTWSRLDRDSRRGAGRDTGPYSDKAIEEQDPRLSKGIFGGLFGKGEGENLTPYERGVLRQQAIYDLAVKRGDVEAIERARANMGKLNQMYEKGLIVEPGKTFTPTGYDNTGGTAPQTDMPQQPETAPQTDMPQQPETALPVSQNDPLYQYGGVGNEAVYTPDYQAFARGGPVGMPSALPQMSALALDDEEPEVETQETTYSLPEDPEELGTQAAEAVDAGYRTLAKRLEPTAAMPDEDENYQASIASYARGEDRMTDEEVAAIDKAVDPDGSLPRAQRTAARMAAIYRYYKDQGDEDTANDVAARLVEYNEFAGQTRARLGAQAIQQGKIQEGVKLLADAYEDNVPDGKSVKANVNPDGSVTVAIGYERKDPEGRISLAPELERTIPLSELPQLAGYFTEQGKRLIMDVGAKANQKAAAGAGGGDLQKSLEEVRAAGDAFRAAQRSGNEDEIAKAQARVDAAVAAANRIPLPRTRTGNQDSAADTRRRNINAALGAVGTAPTGQGATAAKGTAEERAAAARDQATRQSIVTEMMVRADEPTTPAGRAFEPSSEADERAARIQQEQVRRAEATYAGAEKRKAFGKDYTTRVAPLDQALSDLESEAKEDAASKKVDPTTLPKFTVAGKRRFLEVADQLSGANDVSPDRVVRSLYNATQRMAPDAQPRLVTDRTGTYMQIGTERFVVDRDTFRRVAEMRAEQLSKARVENREALRKKDEAPPPPARPTPQAAPAQLPATDYLQQGRGALGQTTPMGVNPVVTPEQMQAIGRQRARQYGIPTE
jgi:hypothetical protein